MVIKFPGVIALARFVSDGFEVILYKPFRKSSLKQGNVVATTSGVKKRPCPDFSVEMDVTNESGLLFRLK